MISSIRAVRKASNNAVNAVALSINFFVFLYVDFLLGTSVLESISNTETFLEIDMEDILEGEDVTATSSPAE